MQATLPLWHKVRGKKIRKWDQGNKESGPWIHNSPSVDLQPGSPHHPAQRTPSPHNPLIRCRGWNPGSGRLRLHRNQQIPTLLLRQLTKYLAGFEAHQTSPGNRGAGCALGASGVVSQKQQTLHGTLGQLQPWTRQNTRRCVALEASLVEVLLQVIARCVALVQDNGRCVAIDRQVPLTCAGTNNA